jgi:hypothetical protein
MRFKSQNVTKESELILATVQGSRAAFLALPMRCAVHFFGIAFALLSATASAQDWDAVTDPVALRALMSDTSMEASLAGGEKATANYRADGTGEVQVWGAALPKIFRWARL